MYFELVEVANELLEYGLIGAGFHTDLLNEFYEKDEYSAYDAVHYALYQSACDVIRVVGSHGFDEEHITANLTGSLAANLSWFARTYRRDKGRDTLPDLQWIHQTKRSEARSGIDFGVLARIPGGDAVKAWRLLVVQAKLGDQGALSIDIDHVTNGRSKLPSTDDPVILAEDLGRRDEGGRGAASDVKDRASKPPLSENAIKMFAAASWSKKVSEFVLTEEVERALTIAKSQFKPREKRYQLETILRTDLRGRALSKTNRDWCFYAGWFPDRLPLAVDVRTLAMDCVARKDDRPKKYVFTDDALDFNDLIRATILEEDAPYGLVISDKQVGKVVDDLLETAPDIRLLLASADGQLDYDLGVTKDLIVSGSLIPRHLIHPKTERDLSVSVTQKLR